jgi:hypothetical protein
MQEILFSSLFQTFPGVKRGTQRVLKSSSKNPSYPNKQILKRKLATKGTGKKRKEEKFLVFKSTDLNEQEPKPQRGK